MNRVWSQCIFKGCNVFQRNIFCISFQIGCFDGKVFHIVTGIFYLFFINHYHIIIFTFCGKCGGTSLFCQLFLNLHIHLCNCQIMLRSRCFINDKTQFFCGFFHTIGNFLQTFCIFQNIRDICCNLLQLIHSFASNLYLDTTSTQGGHIHIVGADLQFAVQILRPIQNCLFQFFSRQFFFL